MSNFFANVSDLNSSSITVKIPSELNKIFHHTFKESKWCSDEELWKLKKTYKKDVEKWIKVIEKTALELGRAKEHLQKSNEDKQEVMNLSYALADLRLKISSIKKEICLLEKYSKELLPKKNEYSLSKEKKERLKNKRNEILEKFKKEFNLMEINKNDC